MHYPILNKNSSAVHFAECTVRSRAIYATLLAVTLATLCMLPILSVEVAIHTTGMIRPAVERTTLHAPVPGIIDRIPFREGDSVARGDTILTLDSTQPAERLERSRLRLAEVEVHLRDLDLLTSLHIDSLNRPSGSSLQSIRYRRSYLEFTERHENLRAEAELHLRQYLRIRPLAMKELASRAELEEARHRYRQADSERQLHGQNRIYGWILDQEELMQERMQLESAITELNLALEQHHITAPVNGTLHALYTLQPGSFLGQNQPAAELSPESELIAELYLTTEKSGLIEPGMRGSLRLDAFSDRQWGTLPITVTDFDDDIRFDGAYPYYRLRCRLDKSWVELPGGVRREIRRGMTGQARLTLTERTLLQLLFDRVDNWLNPMWRSGEEQAAVHAASASDPESDS